MSLGLCYKLSEFSKHCQVQNILKIKTREKNQNLENIPKPIGKLTRKKHRLLKLPNV